MAKLFQGEQHKIGRLMGELPTGKPPWGSGAEQGCPNKWWHRLPLPQAVSRGYLRIKKDRLGGVFQTLEGLV